MTHKPFALLTVALVLSIGAAACAPASPSDPAASTTTTAQPTTTVPPTTTAPTTTVLPTTTVPPTTVPPTTTAPTTTAPTTAVPPTTVPSPGLGLIELVVNAANDSIKGLAVPVTVNSVRFSIPIGVDSVTGGLKVPVPAGLAQVTLEDQRFFVWQSTCGLGSVPTSLYVSPGATTSCTTLLSWKGSGLTVRSSMPLPPGYPESTPNYQVAPLWPTGYGPLVIDGTKPLQPYFTDNSSATAWPSSWFAVGYQGANSAFLVVPADLFGGVTPGVSCTFKSRAVVPLPYNVGLIPGYLIPVEDGQRTDCTVKWPSYVPPSTPGFAPPSPTGSGGMPV